MKPTYFFILLLWFTGALSGIAQKKQQLIVQLDTEVEVKAFVKDIASKKTVQHELYPIKCLSKTLNIWLMEVETATAGVDRTSNASTLLLRAVWQRKGIKSVQYDRPVQLRAVPNDSLYAKQWQYQNKGLERALEDADIDAPEAWEITTGGKSAAGDEIVIAIIDGGIDLQHPDLRKNLWENRNEIPNNQKDDDANGYVDDSYGWNFKMNNSSVDNNGAGHWHGTAVAGIVGAKGNNRIGVSGVNWEVKMMNLVANTTIADIIAAYDYILEMRRRYNDTGGKEGAFIIATNTSLGIGKGHPDEAPIWCAMYDALGEVGIISVAATANENINVDVEGDLPTSCTSDFLISVTNTNATDTKDDLAAYGVKSIDLGAPGTETYTTANRSGYDYFQGTSAAAPHVAGAVGLLYAVKIVDFINDVKEKPAATALRVKNCILNSADPLPSLQAKSVTGGRLNLYKSLHELYTRYDIEPVHIKPDIGIALTTIYPNPASKNFNVDFEVITNNHTLHLQLLDLQGRTVQKHRLGNLSIGAHSIEVPLGAIAKGMYFVKINESGAIKLLVY